MSVFLHDPRVEYLLWEAGVDDRIFTDYSYRLPVLVTGRMVPSPYPDYAFARDELKTIACRRQHEEPDVVVNIPPATELFDNYDWELKPRSRSL